MSFLPQITQCSQIKNLGDLRNLWSINCLEPYFRLGTGWGERLDVGGGEAEELLTLGEGQAEAAVGVTQVDALQLVSHEAGVAPGVLVALGIGLGDELAVFLPSRTGEAVAILTDAAAGKLKQVIDGEVRELEAVGKA